jgi:hypothetical protein
MRRAFGASLAFLLWAGSAAASLTSSEKGQIRDFVHTAHVESAGKVRSLVARTDLTAEESIGVLTEALAPVGYSDARGAFFKELVFGGASAASRPIVALATVKAMLARADAVYDRYVGGLDHEPKAIAELVGIYGFLDSVIANGGKSSIPVASYEQFAKALRDHVDRNARWIKGDGALPAPVVRVRAQAQVALFDMLPEGTTRRVDAADRLGLKGARRTLLGEQGVLFADNGSADDARIDRIRQTLARLPHPDLAVIVTDGGPISARGTVMALPAAERYPFDDPPPASYDPVASGVAHELAVLAARRAIETKPELRELATKDAAEGRIGRPRAPSVEHVLGAAMHAVLVDAPKAVAFAAARLSAGRAEPAALLSDALGALGDGPTIAAGSATIDNVKRAHGVVVGFGLEGKTWTIERPLPSFAVVGMRQEKAAAPPPKRAPEK